MKNEYRSVIKSYHKKGKSYANIGIMLLVLLSIFVVVFFNRNRIFTKQNSGEQLALLTDSGERLSTEMTVEEEIRMSSPEALDVVLPEKQIEQESSVSGEEESLIPTDENSENIVTEDPSVAEVPIEETQSVENEQTPTEDITSNTLKKYAIADVVVKAQDSNSAPVLGTIQEGEEVLLKEEGTSWDTIVYQNQLGYIKKHFLSSQKFESREVEFALQERGIDSTKPMVALTFDDGPNPISTSRILDTLEKYQVVATFFDLGMLVEKYPEIVKREEELGCEVGSHSYEHKNLIKITEEELKADVKKTEDVFVKVLGHKPTLYRPPYGNINITVKEVLDYPLILWNVDSLDWKLRNKTKVLNQIRKTQELDGHIILMHSIYSSTADTVEELIPELIENGYQLVTVSEMAYYKQGTSLKTRNVYSSFQ